MNQGAKDVRDLTDTSNMGAGHGARRNELEEVRTQALTEWSSRQPRQVEEARGKEQKAILPKPKRRYLRSKDKVASPVEQ